MKKMKYVVNVEMKDDVDVNDVYKVLNKIEEVCEKDESVVDYEVVVYEVDE